MNPEQILSKLRSIPLLKEVPDAELRQLTPSMVQRQFAAGELVVREGDPGDELFLIIEGEFQIFLHHEALDFEKELTRLRAGGYFGEIALLGGGKRLASVRAVTAGSALVLHRAQLEGLVARSAGFSLALCRGLAEYVRQSREVETALRFVNLDDCPRLAQAHRLVPPRVSAYCQALAVDRQEDKVTVALVNPRDERVRSFLRDVLRQYRVEFVATSQRDFDRHHALHHGAIESSARASEESLTYVNPEGHEEPLGAHETATVLQNVLGQAIRAGASDVHFEPGQEEGRARMRIDGRMLQLPDRLPVKLFSQMVSRLKVMSELDITSRRLPQDGRFPLKLGGRHVEVRVSVTPCQGGEKVVLRLLDPSRQALDLGTLVLARPVALQLQDLFLSPSGLLLVCGPTGSGKTTTLYAGLQTIWKQRSSLNIVTAEDPVEYQLPFATQIAVNRVVGLDFPQILRTMLRQDPDVILLGEVRDEESAAITLEAATTGHLVLSSLHTDTALEAVARLRSLRAKPYLLAAAVRGIISQRLLPRVCRNCARPVDTNDGHVAQLQRLGVLPADWKGPAHRGSGCEVCRGEGEVGRVAAYELLVVSERLRNLIEDGAGWAQMQESLGPEVFVPLARYARFLIEEGLTAPERVRELFPSRRLADQPGF